MPTRRFTTPEEVATLVALLASPRTGNVTGQLRDRRRPDPDDVRSSRMMSGAHVPRVKENRLVKISDTTDYSRFARPTDEDEGIWLEHVEVHLVTHPAGQVKEMHVHDPPQDHVIASAAHSRVRPRAAPRCSERWKEPQPPAPRRGCSTYVSLTCRCRHACSASAALGCCVCAPPRTAAAGRADRAS
jgi:hypothetical protein